MNRKSGKVGILVDKKERQVAVLKKYLNHNPTSMHLFCFTPDAVDWKRQRIHGIHRRGGKWSNGLFPFPDVIYNRCYRLDAEFAKRLEQTIGSKRYFNQSNQFNKLDIHVSLSRWLAPHLPETSVYTPDCAAQWLEKYDTFYVKPCYGHMGQGVYRVEKKPSGEIHVADHHLKPRIITANTTEYLEQMNQLIEAAPCLIQQGIRVKQWKQRFFDIRVLAQKNKKGLWAVTNMVSRVAYKGCFNTSICETVCLTSTALRELYPGRTMEKLKKQVIDLSLRAAEIVEQSTGNHLCEVSVDLAIDKDGFPWIIEMNGKPQKSLYDEISPVSTNVYSRPLEYAQFVSSR